MKGFVHFAGDDDDDDELFFFFDSFRVEYRKINEKEIISIGPSNCSKETLTIT